MAESLIAAYMVGMTKKNKSNNARYKMEVPGVI